MIVTVTMNPALDKTAEVDTLVPGGLNRLANTRVDAGGKGVNVSKMVAALGGESLATGFAGGGSGGELKQRLAALGLTQDFTDVAGTTRTNLKVLDAEGNLTELNEPGVTVTEGELATLLQKLLDATKPGDVVVLAGSLPAGADTGTYRHFTQQLQSENRRVFVDADGPAFAEALKAGPDTVKPNRFELLQFLNLPDTTPESELPALCRRLMVHGTRLVALSMGADGALFVTKDEALRAPGLRVDGHSPVGAGDSMVGALAFAAERGMSLPDTARLAVASSAGAVTTQGTNAPTKQLVDTLQQQVQLHPV